MINSFLIVASFFGASYGSTVNFEDARRFWKSPASCRLQTLESWHNGENFDLLDIWKQSNQASTSDPSISRVFQRFSPGYYFPDYRRQSSNNTSLMNQVVKVLQSNDIVLRESNADQTNEMRLQVALNACESKNRQYEAYLTLQSLLTFNSTSALFSNIFLFGKLVSIWSEYWTEIRQFWNQQLYLTESQEYQGWITAIQTGQGYASYSETYLSYSSEFQVETYEHPTTLLGRYMSISRLNWNSWFTMSNQQRQLLLQSNNILLGMGFFGYISLLAQLKGLDGPIGRMFGLRQRSKRCQRGTSFKPMHSAHSPYNFTNRPMFMHYGMQAMRSNSQLNQESRSNRTHQLLKSSGSEKDIFLLVAQSLLSRDISMFVNSIIYGNAISHNGRLYRMNSYTGQLVEVANLTPYAAINALLNPKSQPALANKIRQGQTIDTLLCIYENRIDSQEALDRYFRDLRAWYSYGRIRGISSPSVPISPLSRCEASIGFAFQNGTTSASMSEFGSSDKSIGKGIYNRNDHRRRDILEKDYMEGNLVNWKPLSSSSDRRKTVENAWDKVLSGQSIDSTPQITFDVKTKLNRLCQVRQANLINSTEYLIIRKMIADYANTSIAESSSNEDNSTDTQSSLVNLLGNSRALQRPPSYRTPSSLYYHTMIPVRPKRRFLPNPLSYFEPNVYHHQRRKCPLVTKGDSDHNYYNYPLAPYITVLY